MCCTWKDFPKDVLGYVEEALEGVVRREMTVM